MPRYTQRTRKRVTKSRRAPQHHLYTNTIRSVVQKTTTFTLQQLLANTLSGSQSQLDRNIKLVSIGVQAIPKFETETAISRRDIQLLLGGNWSGSGSVSIALKPPLMLSAVNPTFLKYIPTLFQKQPCSAADTGNTFVVQLDTESSSISEKVDLIITTKVVLLPQTTIVDVVGR